MSRTVDITIRLRRPPGIRRIDVLEALIAHGWQPNDGGHVSYVGLGDEDDFDLRCRPLAEWPDVRDELVDKDLAGETLVVAITWRDTGDGGQFFLFRDGSISLVPNIGRRTIGDSRETDLAWYMPKLLDAIARLDGVVIESVETTDND